ncbi:MAG: glycosyltransferase family 2 protein [Deltaproteobacteria bacterium]|nr:glycosyltransferase family 2 protein [Deltaproteobacteria bacterium]
MLNGKKIIVVLPAYNAEKTLECTVEELDRQVVDEILLVDDSSRDQTVSLAREIGIRSFVHNKNYGYGRNQKTCYSEALKSGADVIVMLHPDYQYSPRLVPAMAAMIVSEEYDVVLGSRILGGKARKSGMPVYKYISNRILTLLENLLLGSKLSEFHTGYRAFSRKVLESLPMHHNSDDFLFDNQMLAQAIYFDFKVGEISCPTRYFEEASSINFRRSVVYGLGVLWTAVRFKLQKWGVSSFRIFEMSSPKPDVGYYSEVK